MNIGSEQSHDFVKSTLDSVMDHIAVIDSDGVIQLVNDSWINFERHITAAIQDQWIGINYLDECSKAAKQGDQYYHKAQRGIQSVINKEQENFYLEYPCNRSEKEQWFMMRVSPFFFRQKKYYLICHNDITERKLAEKKAFDLARIDPLTNIANRRVFDEFLLNEWKRSIRKKRKLSLAIIDIDFFKLINDTYGHHAGDNALTQIGGLLKNVTNRPGDLPARFGGEEFAIIWSDTNLEQAEHLAKGLLEKIRDLNIPNRKSPVKKYLTVSIGVASMAPAQNMPEAILVEKADEMLYRAKKNGRFRVECQSSYLSAKATA